MGAPIQYGGQAVIEGVMMRGPQYWAVAVRRPDRSIVVDKKPLPAAGKRFFLFRWPFGRGVYALAESLWLGIEALSFSAALAAGEEEKLSGREIALTVAAALGLAVFLFAVLPVWGARWLMAYAPGSLAQNLIEGFFRIAVFLAYVAAIGRLPDIKRVFAYHGAEHKVINAYEAGDGLTVESARRHSVLHPRCGTSFLLVVLVVSILFFSLLGNQVLWWRILSRVLLLPVVAGISYEFIKFTAKHAQTRAGRLLAAPGLWLQRLTTSEPEDEQLEVALSAFKAVLEEEVRAGAG